MHTVSNRAEEDDGRGGSVEGRGVDIFLEEVLTGSHPTALHGGIATARDGNSMPLVDREWEGEIEPE